MRRQTALSLTLAAALAACGNGGGPTDDAGPAGDAGPVDGAVVDGGGADAAPGPLGLWRMTQSTTGGTTIGTSGPDRLSGTLELSSDGMFAHALALVVGGRLDLPDPGTTNDMPGYSASYTLSADNRTITFGGWIMTWDPGPPEVIRLSGPPTETIYERTSHADTEMLTVQGQISFRDTGSFVPIVTPRVGLVFLLRAPAGQPDIIEVPGGDVALAGFGDNPSATIDFDLSRTEGALGVERITFGTGAFASMALVVVYDDVTGNGQLDTLWTSCAPGQDCVRGISPLVVAYRLGSSPELAASPYAYMRKGWTVAVKTQDHRMNPGRLGLISLDKSVQEPPFDVQVPTEPSAVVLPALEL